MEPAPRSPRGRRCYLHQRTQQSFQREGRPRLRQIQRHAQAEPGARDGRLDPALSSTQAQACLACLPLVAALGRLQIGSEPYATRIRLNKQKLKEKRGRKTKYPKSRRRVRAKESKKTNVLLFMWCILSLSPLKLRPLKLSSPLKGSSLRNLSSSPLGSPFNRGLLSRLLIRRLSRRLNRRSRR